ncbi:DUF7289 family protein [Halodesulfurarchaeum sp.]|uniref:DUF7289 family protein n=1 Tax=Halodesulfurarchaeum sp. TaxID=1980530 RepID=UPI002FC2FA06
MDRAVSDVLGYILIFSLILSSVAVVTAGGYSSLNSVRDAERFDNAQRVFDVLDENVDDHLETGVTSRGTEIRLADARIGFGDPVKLNVTVKGYGSNQTTVEPLLYTQSSEREIAYSGGATVRTDRGASIIKNDPPFRIGDETIVTFVETRPRDSGISGSGRVLVRTELSADSVHEYTGSGSPLDVTLNVTSPRTSAWEQWFESETDGNCTVVGNTASCTFETETLYVRTVAIDVFLQ